MAAGTDPRVRRAMAWGAVALLLALAAVGLNTTRNAARLSFVTDTPQERAAALAGTWRLVVGAGPPPHPAAALLSGCDGVHDNMDRWAAVLSARGRSGLIVDSHTHRHFDRVQAWRLTCSGQVLTGAERAGDLAVALAALADWPGIEGRAVVLGASHGGWAAMEFAGLALGGVVPPGLTEWPAPPGELLSSVAAIVLLYPYCGVLNRAEEASLAAAPPVLMILAGDDGIVSTPACEEMAGRMRERGASVEVVVVPGAGHGFDQQERAFLSPLHFDAEATALAEAEVTRFLDAHGL